MGIQFNSPWFLLLLLLLPFYLYWISKHTVRLTGSRKKTALILRSLVLLLLLLALSGMQWYIVSERQEIVFITDRSDSIADSGEWLDWMKTAANEKQPDDRIGVVALGLDAAIERKADHRQLDGFQWSSPVNRQFTNLEAGLRAAAGLFSDEYSPRIVLASDGEENAGDLLRQGRLLRDQGVPVDVLPIPSQRGRDVAVEQIKVPEKLYQGEQYTLEIMLNSTEAVSGELRVYEDNRELTVQQIELERGENRFALQSLAKEPGFHRYRAEIYVKGDTQTANNTAASFSRVSGPPKVLLVEGDPGTSQNLISVLDAGLIPYDLISPEMLSRDLATYASYESILLNNVPATRMAQEQMEMMEQAVRDYGIGLVMFGGENSFGLGGYFQTPIENALPVYMDLRGKREIPSLGLVLVIDKSGSMSDGKMNLAQEAAVRTVDLLREKDTLGVLAFDSSPWWVSEPEPLTDKEKVIREINSIPADGGTEIYTAVEEAYSSLLGVEAQRKHIILLTDGQSATNQSYEALAANMAANNITMSAVAIGDGADTLLLERIAGLANGRYYFANDQSTVPAIFSREATMISRTYIVDQPFTPLFGQGADWNGLLQEGIPPINAYIATTPKEMAEVVLMSPEPDPVLARWQYGSGRTVAWTSDITGQWSSDWIAWSGFQNALSQIIKWTFPQFDASPFELNTRFQGGQALLEVTSSDADYQGPLKAVITNEDLESQEVVLTPTIPGEYTGEFPVQKPGAYLTRIERLEADDGEAGDSRAGFTSGFVIPYSPEYSLTEGSGLDKLERLAETTGGRVLSLEHPEEVFASEVKEKKHYRDLTRLLLIAALLLWVADIAVRRFSFTWSRLLAPVLKRGKVSPQASVPDSDTTWSRLRRSKDKVNQRVVVEQEQGQAGQDTGSLLSEARKAGEGRLPSSADKEPQNSGIKQDKGLSPETEKQPEGKDGDTMSRLLAAKKRKKL